MKKTIRLVFLLVLSVLFSNNLLANKIVKLDIKIIKVNDDKILCNFVYHFDITKNETIDIYQLILPFNESQNLDYSFLSNDVKLFATYGFNSTGKGLLNINTFKNSAKFDIEFINVEIPFKETLSDENGLVVNLDFSSDQFPKNIKNIKTLSISEFKVKNSSLLNSLPRLKLIEDETYLLSSNFPIENAYFVIPKPKEKYVTTFFAFMSIAIFLGIISALKLMSGKTESIFGLIIGILVLIYLCYLVISKIIPENFTKDIDMISLLGGGIGFCFGIISNATYNLIKIHIINRQQSST